MSRRTLALTGAASAIAYVCGVIVTGSLGSQRLLLLDGLAPPPSYHYVQTPPGMAPSKRPYAGTFTVRLGRGKSRVYAFSTKDQQVYILLGPGAVPPRPGQQRLEIHVQPLAPSGFPEPGGNLAVDGNVYRVVARYLPGGDLLARFARPGMTLHLVYPVEASKPGARHVMLYAHDRSRWQPVGGHDLGVQQQVSLRTTRLGYYAVGGPPLARPGASPVAYAEAALAALVVAVLAVLIFLEGRTRRRRKRAG